jgi:hypothetical protein
MDSFPFYSSLFQKPTEATRERLDSFGIALYDLVGLRLLFCVFGAAFLSHADTSAGFDMMAC